MEKDYNYWYSIVKENPYELKNVPIQYLDKEICLKACENNALILEFVPKGFKDENFCLEVFKKNFAWNNNSNSSCLDFIPRDIIDKDFCLKVCELRQSAMKFIPREFIDREFCLNSLKKFFTKDIYINSITKEEVNKMNSFDYVPEEFLDRDFYLQIAKKWYSNVTTLECVPEEFKDRDFCLEVCKYNFTIGTIIYDNGTSKPHNSFDYVPSNIKDKDFYLEVCKFDLSKTIRNNVYKYIPKDFWEDKKFCLDALEMLNTIDIFNNIPKDFWNDKEFCLNALEIDNRVLDNIPNNFWNNKHFSLDALKIDKKASEYIFKEPRYKGLYLEIVKNNLIDFVNFPHELKNYTICLEACKNNGLNLKYVPYKFREFNLCLEACINDSNALQWVPDNLSTFKNDLEKAINNNTLNTFKEDCPYYFQKTLDNLKDDSISFNDCLKTFRPYDLNNSKVIDALCDRFSQYECSKDFNLDELKKDPNELFNNLKSFNFDNEEFTSGFGIEKK